MELINKPFVFLRHGETAMNRQRLIGGRTDTPLNETGRQEARAASKLLSSITWSVIGVSPLKRAHETAQLAAPGQLLTLLDGLKERDWGELEGIPWEQIIPYTDTPPGGESWNDFTDRVQTDLNSLLQQHEMPLIVAHSGIYRVIRSLATGTPEGERIGNAQPMLILPPDTTDPNWRFQPFTSATKEHYFD